MAVPEAARTQPRSAHVADPSLAPFLLPSFDAADYLNSTLPQLAMSSSTVKPGSAAPVSLAQASAQTQTLLSTLNAQTSRLSATLTQMADDILRSGGRLAYQVEVLRGEAVGLTEAFADDAQADVHLFVPLPTEQAAPNGDSAPPDPAESSSPPFLDQLKMLVRVRSRLETVIKVFGEAMQWTLPPSELSIASSFISVSSPEAGADSQSREEKGREFAERLRTEIADLITGGGQDGDGYVAAMQRIEALRDLSRIWKGTSEEKARAKFVDSLVKIAEERARALERDAGKQKSGLKTQPGPQQTNIRPSATDKTHGFLENLQKIRSGIYLE